MSAREGKSGGASFRRRGAAVGAALAGAVAVLTLIGGWNPMFAKFSREVGRAGLKAAGQPGAVVTEAEVAAFPPTVQRYLRFMRVVGRPRDTSFRAHLRGKFRPKRDGGWLEAEAWQFNSQPDVARFFYMQLRMMGVPVLGRDVFAEGKGSMVIRPLDLFTLEDSRGPEFDIGELVTYLNDAVLIAPSMLLAPGVEFAAVNDASFDVSLSHAGLTVEARVFLDERGAPRNFETTDRFIDRVRTRWSTPIDGYQEADGHLIPTTGRAVWHLPDGDYVYGELRFEPADVTFNLAPGA